MRVYLYLIASRIEALVASHLDPAAFGLYMAVGPKRQTSGRVVFFEVDPTLRSDYFRLGDLAAVCPPQTDGSPKPSKYLRVYRVLEHIPLAALGKLFLTTNDGLVLELSPQSYDEQEAQTGPFFYQELCPLTPQVVATVPPHAFLKQMTAPENPVSVPKLFFADLRLEFEENGRISERLPYPDQGHILECLRELETRVGKTTKTVSRSPHVYAFYRTIRRGFYVGDTAGLKFYPYPDRQELQIKHSTWWHSASAQ